MLHRCRGKSTAAPPLNSRAITGNIIVRLWRGLSARHHFNVNVKLTLIQEKAELIFNDGIVKVRLNAQHQLLDAAFASASPSTAFRPSHTLNMEVYYNFYYLLTGMLDARHLNQVNAAWPA